LFELAAADGKMIRVDRAEGKDRQILFIQLPVEALGNQSKALAQWCERSGGFVAMMCGVRRLRRTFTDYTLSDYLADAGSC
jgi:hypothetical protein